MACMLAESYESAKKSEYNPVKSSVHGILQTDMQTVSRTTNEALPHKTYKYGTDARTFYVKGVCDRTVIERWLVFVVG